MISKGNLEEEEFREKALSSSLFSLVFSLGLPLAFYFLFNGFFGLLDTIMASHIGSLEVSSISYLSQLQNLILSLGAGLISGAMIKINQAFGKGDAKEVREDVSSLYAMLLVIIGLLLLLIPFVPVFLRLLKTPEDFIRIGTKYFRVLLFATAINLINTLYINIEKTRGRTRLIMVLNILVLVIKLSLTALFVYVLDGTVVSIALATLISYLFLFIVSLFHLFDKKSLFSIAISNLKIRSTSAKPILSLSFPLMVEKSAFSLGKTVTNSMIATLGALSVGALGVSMSISGLLSQMQSGFSDSAVAVISQNVGAKRHDRVVKAYFAVLFITVALSLVGTIILYIFSDSLIHIFAESKSGYDAYFETLIKNVFRYDLFSCLPLAFNAAASALILATGRTKISFLVSISRIFIFRIPVLYFLMHYTSLGTDSVGVMMIISNGSTAILSTLIAIGIIIKEKRTING